MLIENPKVVLKRFQKRLDEIQNAPQNVAGEDNSDWNASSTLTLLFIKQELERSVRLLEEGECPDWLKPKAKKVKWEAPFDGLTCGDLLEQLKPADPDLPVYLSADGTYSDELFHCRSITYYPGNQYARTVLRMYTPGGLLREPPFLRHKKGKEEWRFKVKDLIALLQNSRRMKVDPEWPVMATNAKGETFAIYGAKEMIFNDAASVKTLVLLGTK